MKKRKNRLLFIFLVFLCTLPIAVSFAKYYEEVQLEIKSKGGRPALLLEKKDMEIYHTRNSTTTYQFTVKNSDTNGLGEVKLQYTLEFQMPISTGITYSLKKGNTAVSLLASGVTTDGKTIFKTNEQFLPVTAQTDLYTLTAVNSSTRSVAILDTMKIIVQAEQAAS